MERQNMQVRILPETDKSEQWVEKVAIWEPTQYKSVCTHCRTTNFSKQEAQHVRIKCNKEYLAKVAHSEED